MQAETLKYNQQQQANHKAVCDLLAREIGRTLPGAENKIWHAHPVWFLDGNPTVGYSRQKPGVRLMFWSGADFVEAGLNVVGRKFKDEGRMERLKQGVSGLHTKALAPSARAGKLAADPRAIKNKPEG